MQDVKLDGALVKEVSRSFYLTLRLLPANVREVISLGYLLARASDTIADTADLDWQRRKECLELYRVDVLRGVASEGLLKMLIAGFSEQKHEGERVLMEQVSSLFDSLSRFSSEEQEMLRDVTGTIIDGQLWDLEYFQAKDEIQSVKSDRQLEHYTYQVAGCVGEFWTRILAYHGYIEPCDLEALLKKGVNYGKGLQLTNIIRDIGEDFDNGRVYIPGEGESTRAVLMRSEAWIQKAKGYLQDGVDYSKMLPKGRLRVATELPARLGVKTLDLLTVSSLENRASSKVKISRSAVFKELFKCVIS